LGIRELNFIGPLSIFEQEINIYVKKRSDFNINGYNTVIAFDFKLLFFSLIIRLKSASKCPKAFAVVHRVSLLTDVMWTVFIQRYPKMAW